MLSGSLISALGKNFKGVRKFPNLKQCFVLPRLDHRLQVNVISIYPSLNLSGSRAWRQFRREKKKNPPSSGRFCRQYMTNTWCWNDCGIKEWSSIPRTEEPAWWAAVHGIAKSRTQLSDFTFTFHFHALEKEMATHSNVLAWRIPGTGEPGGLPSLGWHRVGHDWSDLAATWAPPS